MGVVDKTAAFLGQLGASAGRGIKTAAQLRAVTSAIDAGGSLLMSQAGPVGQAIKTGIQTAAAQPGLMGMPGRAVMSAGAAMAPEAYKLHQLLQGSPITSNPIAQQMMGKQVLSSALGPTALGLGALGIGAAGVAAMQNQEKRKAGQQLGAQLGVQMPIQY